MNVQERHDRILTLLQTRDMVEIAELSTSLDVSRETVRKDLYDLERNGLLTKVRGGAVLAAPGKAETAYDLRKGEESSAKKAIAKIAASLVQPGDTVFLDYGTTTFMVAEELEFAEGITVISNALPIINRLVANTEITLIVPGGIVRTNENSLYGPLTANNTSSLFPTIGFFGCGGIDAVAGVTNHNIFETEISRIAIANSHRAVLLADHTKFGQVAANKAADFSDLATVITDVAPVTGIAKQLDSADIDVRVAPPTQD